MYKRQTEWFVGDIAKAVAAGYMIGDAEGTFRPDDPIARQEAALVLARIYELKDQGKKHLFKDSDEIASWSHWAVMAVVDAGLMEGYPDGTFGPKNPIKKMCIRDRKEQMREIYLACRDAEEKLTAMRTAGTRIQAALTELEPWAGFPLPLEEIADTKRVQMQLIAVPGESAASFKEMLEDKVPAGFLQEISRGKDQVYGLLIWLAEEAAAVSEMCIRDRDGAPADPDNCAADQRGRCPSLRSGGSRTAEAPGEHALPGVSHRSI